MRDHGRAARQHVGVTRPPPDRHVLRSTDHRRVDRGPGGHQRVNREPPERVGGSLQQVLLAHHGTAQADQDQRATFGAGPRIVPCPTAGIVELGPDIADVAGDGIGGEIIARAGTHQDPAGGRCQLSQVMQGSQAELGAGLVEGRHPSPEQGHRQRPGSPVTQPPQAPARRQESQPDRRSSGARQQVRPVHQQRRGHPRRFGPGQRGRDQRVNDHHVGRLSVQLFHHVTAELPGRAEHHPVADPGEHPQRRPCLPVLDEVRLGPPQIIVRGMPVRAKARTSRLKPAPQPFGPQHPHLVTASHRPPHHRLDGFHAPAAVPPSHQDPHLRLHPLATRAGPPRSVTAPCDRHHHRYRPAGPPAHTPTSATVSPDRPGNVTAQPLMLLPVPAATGP